MVKFQVRKVKKRYKREEYCYRRYSLNFPSSLNESIAPHLGKNFRIEEFKTKETAEKEIVSLILARNKTAAENARNPRGKVKDKLPS